MAVRHVRERFAADGAKTKDQMAGMIVTRFPQLATKLPPPRKPWMAEDQRMAIFDAVGMGLTQVVNHAK